MNYKGIITLGLALCMVACTSESVSDETGAEDSAMGPAADSGLSRVFDTFLEFIPSPEGGARADGAGVLKRVTLAPEDYTNEPIQVGQVGMGFQYDDLSDPVQVVKSDDRCGIVHGAIGGTSLVQYKEIDGMEELGIGGVKIVIDAFQFQVTDGQVIYGNEGVASATTIALGLCPTILVDPTNTIFESDAQDGVGGCEVPFIVAGVTYVAQLGQYAGCGVYELAEGDEVYLFSRYDQESGFSYVLVPVVLKDGSVWSPCVPMDSPSVDEFQAELDELI
jgi:hypothetical protein